MRVLVTGAYGFIGAFVAAALEQAGHAVVRAVRYPRGGDASAITCDLARDVDAADWRPRLAGVDAVVNCAGILRERGADTFDAVHVRAPLALFGAAVQGGITRLVQVSALGDPADGAFIASKHRLDAAALELHAGTVVLRPSVVYSVRGSYGGTSLLRALAALPGVVLLPGGGQQRLQPLAAEDFARIVVAAVERPVGGAREVGGPDTVTLRDYLVAWRRWLHCAPAVELAIPAMLVRVAAALGERIGAGPFGRTTRRMLERGNIVRGVDASGAFGVPPRALADVLAATPSQVQDRWHARLYFVLPLLRFTFASLWIGSGLLGLLLPAAAVATASDGGPLDPHTAVGLARAAGALDLVLGVLCLSRWRPRTVLAAMAAMVAAYTVLIGIAWPRHWLDPYGGLAKNVPILAALAVLLATEERR